LGGGHGLLISEEENDGTIREKHASVRRGGQVNKISLALLYDIALLAIVL